MMDTAGRVLVILKIPPVLTVGWPQSPARGVLDAQIAGLPDLVRSLRK